MRVKKKSRHRKAVKFYATCFGFREPYKVLIDGTFVHHLLAHRLLPADEALRDLLSASRTPALSTSKCILAELRRLGKSHADAFDAAKLLETTKCDHEKVVSAVNCVLSLVGDKNPEHFFVATQDADLREKLREIPGVPVIYGLKNSLFIEQPSVHQRKFAQLDEEKRLNMDISEYKKLLKVASEGNAADSEDGTGGERPMSSLVKNALGVAEKSKFKKNRPKLALAAAVSTKPAKKRPRASRRPPTTVLTTDTSNFRAMVQEFTGFPAPPFAAAPPPAVRPRLLGGPPPFLMRPSPLKYQHSSSMLLPPSSCTATTTLQANTAINTAASSHHNNIAARNSSLVDALALFAKSTNVMMPSTSSSAAPGGSSGAASDHHYHSIGMGGFNPFDDFDAPAAADGERINSHGFFSSFVAGGDKYNGGRH